MDPKNPEILYATIWQVYRTPYKMLGGGPECGIYKSVDGGMNWIDISEMKGYLKDLLEKLELLYQVQIQIEYGQLLKRITEVYFYQMMQELLGNLLIMKEN